MIRQKDRKSIIINTAFAAMVIVILGSVYKYAQFIIEQSPELNFNVDSGGTFGDSFGILTSLFSGLAFAALIWTVMLQREELRLQRGELFEARRQAVLTRLMTVTQNQIEAYRKEVEGTEFRKLSSYGTMISTGPKLREMNYLVEKILNYKDIHGDDPTGVLQQLVPLKDDIESNLTSYRGVLEGLHRCLESNKVLIKNNHISSEEGREVLDLLFSELPTGLLIFCQNVPQLLQEYVSTYLSVREVDYPDSSKLDIFIEHCKRVIEYKSAAS